MTYRPEARLPILWTPVALPSVNLIAVRRGVSRMLRDPDRKPVVRILRDLAEWRQTRASHPRDYFQLALYRRDSGDPRRYVAASEWRAIVRSWRTKDEAEAFRDKVAFHDRMASVPGVRQPRRLGVVNRAVYVGPEGGPVPIRSHDDFARLVWGLVETVGGRPLFLKPTGGREGRGAFRLGDGPLPEAAWEAVRTQRYLIEEAVRQHPVLDAIYPGCLNTARFVTCRRAGEAPEILGAFLRVGTGGRPVDNVGGLFAPLDPASGRVRGPLRQTVADGGGTFERHPDTGALAEGVVVPGIGKAVETVRRAASVYDYPVVGWDIGFSTSGPVLVEGNDWPGYTKLQAATGGLLDNPTFVSFLRSRPVWEEVQAWSGLQ